MKLSNSTKRGLARLLKAAVAGALGGLVAVYSATPAGAHVDPVAVKAAIITGAAGALLLAAEKALQREVPDLELPQPVITIAAPESPQTRDARGRFIKLR
jgi:hypothetical protein